MVVFDRNGVMIEPGDVVVCVEPIDGFIALNGLYTVKDVLPEEFRIAIEPDLSGKLGHFKASRFEVVDLTNLPQY